ncbi:MAG: hypothetical protein AAB885_01715, partial [Patescibacteria group bacterium]
MNAVILTDEPSIHRLREMLKERNIQYKVENMKSLFLDLGGSIHMEEPIIDFESTNGIQFRAYARHLPILGRILFAAKDYTRMPG